MVRIFECYPFKQIGVRVAEGFAAFDGTLRDLRGQIHGGIDYVLPRGGELASFEVYSMFEGRVTFGVSNNWGKFFIISKEQGQSRFDCVYAHLDHLDMDLQKYEIIHGQMDFFVPARQFLGWASSTGATHGVRRLHIEILETDLANGNKRKIDPYGVYDKLSSGKYRQPGQSLAGLNHLWTSDEPEFA